MEFDELQSEKEEVDSYYKALYSVTYLSQLQLSKTFKYLDILRK